MCGIVGYIGNGRTKDILIRGLERLEYRGYDSAGIATIADGRLTIEKIVGKIRDLRDVVGEKEIIAHVGLAHTRWATHGAPTTTNAHPHTDCLGRIAVVHNGIIENYDKLKVELQSHGHVIKSQTDTELIPHLIEEELEKDSGDIIVAVLNALKRIEGTFAVGIIFAGVPEFLIVARRRSPLIIGLGNNENFIASDVSAVIEHTRKVIYLRDNEVGVVYMNKVKLMDFSGEVIIPKIDTILWDVSRIEKGGYPYYMLKEIHQQPEVVMGLFNLRTKKMEEVVFENLEISDKEFTAVTKIFIQACGTSYHAGLVGKYLIERFLRIPVEVDISSEFRYRRPIIGERTLLISISQSGETADTIAGLEEGKKLGAKTLSICNVVGSTITRMSDAVIYINAGPEIGVASTKAYTAQITTLYLLTLYLGKLLNKIPAPMLRALIWQLKKVPEVMEDILVREQEIKNISYKYFHCTSALFLGRGVNYPTALEGALKLKEISYIHASGYAAGEMKHGPIALIDKDTPVFCVAPNDATYEKMLSNIQEVRARSGRVIAIATAGNKEVRLYADEVFYIQPIEEYLSPLVTIVPLQLFAYYIAVMRGCDVDKPRNLAKSVTVE